MNANNASAIARNSGCEDKQRCKFTGIFADDANVCKSKTSEIDCNNAKNWAGVPIAPKSGYKTGCTWSLSKCCSKHNILKKGRAACCSALFTF